MRISITAMLDYQLAEAADLLLAVEVAPMADQRLVTDRLVVDGVDTLRPVAGEEGIGRRTLSGAETSARLDLMAKSP